MPRLTPRQRAVALYQGGATLREVAEDVGADNTTVRRWLVEAGVATRPRGAPLRGDVQDSVIIEVRDEGATWSEVAEAVGMSMTGVRRRYRAATEPDFKRWG